MRYDSGENPLNLSAMKMTLACGCFVAVGRWFYISFACRCSDSLLDGRRVFWRAEESLSDFLLSFIDLGSNNRSAAAEFCDLRIFLSTKRGVFTPTSQITCED